MSNAGWKQLVATMLFDEPPMRAAPGRPPASGAVVVESDGRVWVDSPSKRLARVPMRSRKCLRRQGCRWI